MIEVAQFVFNPFSENTYVIYNKEKSEAIIIDPGCSDSFEETELSDFIADNNLTVKYMIVTHGHVDHVLGVNFVKQKYNPIYLAPEADIPLLKMADKQGAAFGVECSIPASPDYHLSERSIIEFGSSEIFPLFTPGHSPGEHCLYFKNEGFCISGDVLFKGSVGRTDLWGGDYNTLISSIRDRLFILPEDTVIYPGHGDVSRIGIEKKENPFVKE